MYQNTTGTNIVSMEILDLEVENLNRFGQLLAADRIDKFILAILAHSRFYDNSIKRTQAMSIQIRADTLSILAQKKSCQLCKKNWQELGSLLRI